MALAAASNIQPGDVIEEVNRQPVGSVEDFNSAMVDAKDQGMLLLLVRCDNTSSFFALCKAG